MCKGSETSGSQLLVETSSLQINEEVPLHQEVSGAKVAFNLSNPLSVGTQSTLPILSETVQNSERLASDQEKGEVERVRTLDGSSEIERVGAQPHCEGETRNVTTFVDDVMNAGCFLPEVLLLPPPNSKSGEDEAPEKMPTFSYYDQIWVYSELETFKSGISKEDFVVIYNLQRIDRISALEKSEPVQLSLQNQVSDIRE